MKTFVFWAFLKFLGTIHRVRHTGIVIHLIWFQVSQSILRDIEAHK